MNKKVVGAFLLGVLLTVLLYWPAGLFSQGPAGFTKVNTAAITTSPYVDSGLARNTGYSYSVTAVNSAGVESGPSNIVTGVTQDNTNLHRATLTFQTISGLTYNVYRLTIPSPAAPTGLTVVIE